MAETPQDLVAALPLPETVANPYPLYTALRANTPIFGYRDYPPGTVPGQDEPVTAWVLMKHADVAAAARDHETFSSRDPLQEASSAPTLMLVNTDNPEHDRLRKLVNTVFSRRTILALKPWIAERVAAILDQLEQFQGQEGNGEVEVCEHLTSVVPALVMMKLLGCPDEDALKCRGWATAFMLSADLSPDQREASNRDMFVYFTERVTALASKYRGEGQAAEVTSAVEDGLIGALLAANVDGESLTLDEVIRFCLTLVVAGSETTTFLLTNLLYNLATMPQVAEQLRREPKKVAAFIEETLRHSGPPQRLFRIATRDVAIGDAQIRAGDWVALFFAAANHDETVFSNPEHFDLERPNANEHLSMGLGIHQCLGFAVAKTEAAALVETILARFANLTLGESAAEPQTASLLTHGYDSLALHFKR